MAHTKKQNIRFYVGKIISSHNGDKAKIIAYDDWRHVWIQFRDGVLKGPCRCDRALNGNILHPDDESFWLRKRHIGERKQLSNGQWVRIAEFNNPQNIVVVFETNNRRIHTNYQKFKKGILKKEQLLVLGKSNEERAKSSNNRSFNEMVCATYLQGFGFQKMSREFYKKLGLGKREFDLFNSNLNVAVEYDGELYHQNVEKDLRKDEIAAKKGITLYRIREPLCPTYNSFKNVRFFPLKNRKQGNRLLLKVLEHIAKELIREFPTITVKNLPTIDLQQMARRASKMSQREGEVVIDNQGRKITLVKWNTSENIDITVEGYPYILHNQNYHHIFRERKEPENVLKFFNDREFYRGVLSKDGHKMTLVKHSGLYADIKIDGYPEIIKHARYFDVFKKRREPLIAKKYFFGKAQEGKSIVDNQGRLITLVTFWNSTNIDIMVEGFPKIYKHANYNRVFVQKHEPQVVLNYFKNKGV